MEYQLALSPIFGTYKQQIVELYINTFSKEPTFQYLSKIESEEYIESLISNGFGIIAIENKYPAGILLACPLSFDHSAPDSLADSINPSKTIYIAELMVDERYRGRGVGKSLLTKCLEHAINRNYTDALIRVWDRNETALKLYQKMGFNIVESIIQPKMKADRSGSFNFRKYYLHKKISTI